MADRFITPTSVKAGKTSVSVWIQLKATTTSAPVTAVAHTDLTSASYIRQGGTRTAITLSALAAIDSSFSAGGWKEADATNLPGLYRLDVPDAAFATGADWVIISVAKASTIAPDLVIALPTLGTVASAVTDDIIETEGSVTLQQALSVMLSILAGRTTGGGLTFKTPNNAATRVTATTDTSKNRTAISLNPSL